jgi:1,4-dihydroxy-6-naphthoate synthase
MKLEFAISPCPNDVFIFAGLISGAVARAGWEPVFEFHELEALNRGARKGLWDAVKISYANYRNCEAAYGLLRCGGALGRGCWPLLLTNGAAFDPSAEVLVPGESTTANLLLDFHAAAGKAGPLRKRYIPFDEIYRRLLGPEPCQGVVIHEMRFTYAADGLRLIRDLGAHWEEDTGYPIPLGAVALRRSLPGNEGVPAGEIVEDLVRASLDWSYNHREEALALCRLHAQSMSEEVLASHIALYVNDFTRDLGADGARAVEFLLGMQKSVAAP